MSKKCKENPALCEADGKVCNPATGKCVKRLRIKNTTQKNKSAKSQVAPAALPPADEYAIFHSKAVLLDGKAKDVGEKIRRTLPNDVLRRLSNFSEDDVEYEGHQYPTVEHAYQAQKYTCVRGGPRLDIVSKFYTGGDIKTALQAKTAGGKGYMKKEKVELDFGCWDAKKNDLMLALILSKVQRHPYFQDVLRKAHQQGIRFVHHSRSDMYWGAHFDRDHHRLKQGKNKLGEIFNVLAAHPNQTRPSKTLFAEVLADDGAGSQGESSSASSASSSSRKSSSRKRQRFSSSSSSSSSSSQKVHGRNTKRNRVHFSSSSSSKRK